MPSTKHNLSHRTWHKDAYFISTDPALVPIPELNATFATDIVYWAKPLPEDVMRETLENSLCFGLYELNDSSVPNGANPPTEALKFVGFARCITDFTTFLYLTDVFINPGSQGKGLGAWLIECVQEVIDSMPYLRRSMLFTGDWKRSVPFYEKLMGMRVAECKRGADGISGEGVAIMQKPGPGWPTTLPR